MLTSSKIESDVSGNKLHIVNDFVVHSLKRDDPSSTMQWYRETGDDRSLTQIQLQMNLVN